MRKIILHFDADSFQARKSRCRGPVKLTQNIFMITNKKSSIPPASYKTFSGSNQCDLFGPVKLQPLAEVPAISKKEMLEPR